MAIGWPAKPGETPNKVSKPVTNPDPNRPAPAKGRKPGS